MALNTGVKSKSTDLGSLFMQVNSSSNLMYTGNSSQAGNGTSTAYTPYKIDEWFWTGGTVKFPTAGYYLVSLSCYTPQSNDTETGCYALGISNTYSGSYSTSYANDTLVYTTPSMLQGKNDLYDENVYSYAFLFNNIDTGSTVTGYTPGTYYVVFKVFSENGKGATQNEYNIMYTVNLVYLGETLFTGSQQVTFANLAQPKQS
jgi:hypothetical protein